MDEVTIYTDGACSGNPGPGGWGAVLMYKNNKKEISGGAKETTNNIMELTAVIEGLKLLKYPCKVKLYSDSAYVVNAFKKYNNVDVPYKIVGRRSGDIAACYADASHAKEILGWSSIYDIEDMVKDAYLFTKINNK